MREYSTAELAIAAPVVQRMIIDFAAHLPSPCHERVQAYLRAPSVSRLRVMCSVARFYAGDPDPQVARSARRLAELTRDLPA